MFKITIEKTARDYIKVNITEKSHDFKGQFGIRIIPKDNIDAICEARHQPETAYLCLLSDDSVGIVEDISYSRKAKLGPGVMINKYNQHPLVLKSTHPSIVKWRAITHTLIESVVHSDNLITYLKS